MRILITGGAGFVGSHLTDRFLGEGHQVIAVDNLVTGDLRNVAHHESNPNFQFIKQDICEPFTVAGAVDWVLNFASPASPIDYLKLPFETLKVGAYGTFNALDLARAKGAKYMLASTSEVYGDPLVHPQPESYWGNVNPNGPRSVYDEAKRFAESVSLAHHREYEMDVRVIRIFNTYGERNRVNDGRVVPTFINQALHGEPLTVFGAGQQTRSFQYVGDLVEGVCRLMRVKYHQPVNLGNPHEMTILEFAQLILQLTGSRSQIEYRPLPQDDPKTRKPDISRAKEILDWEPRIAVTDGLARTIAWYRTLG
jgi:dTDP-glucose 4,6-dehydratase